MNKRIPYATLCFGAWAVLALLVWKLLPDRYMGPYNAWNPHAIVEFVITIFLVSLAGKVAVQWLGAHFGLLLTGLVGGFASSTATIHSMGAFAKSQPQLSDRAALGGVMSNISTLVQLMVLLRLLAPEVLTLFMQPLCVGLVGLGAYVLWILALTKVSSATHLATKKVPHFDWKSAIKLTALVCSVSYVSALLNAKYGQSGIWVGAAVSGLVDAHAIIPTMASLLTHGKLEPQAALLPLLIALSANTVTKSLIAFQSGGWPYAKKVSMGVWVTTLSVWLGFYLMQD